MNDGIMQEIMGEVISRLGQDKKVSSKLVDEELVEKKVSEDIDEETSSDKLDFLAHGVTEFIGVGPGDTIGIAIAGVDDQFLEKLGFDKKYKAIGLVGGRTGAGPQVLAADEAVKSTNTEILRVELSRDTKGGGGHGAMVVFGSSDISDIRNAVEISLKVLDRTFTTVYSNNVGHLEIQYTANASYALEKAFGARVGEPFGIIVGSPAPIGFLMSDRALKSAGIEILKHGTPSSVPYPNEVSIFVTGDSEAVKQSVIVAREVGETLLETLGQEKLMSSGKAYI